MSYACPLCHSTEIDVQVMTWARLYQTSDGDIQTDSGDSLDGSHEWDGHSEMLCRECSHSGSASTFRVLSAGAAFSVNDAPMPLDDLLDEFYPTVDREEIAALEPGDWFTVFDHKGPGETIIKRVS